MVAAGGLHIVGTERHESRRIDNQLRGRSGRQGDPGSSRFYLSMEDNLMRIFGDPMRTKRLLQMAGMKAGEVIESGMLTRQIEKAQRKVESHNFDIRKQLLLFDDVANDQRKVVYQQRTEIIGARGSVRSRAAASARRRSTISSTSSCRSTPRPPTGIWRGCAEAVHKDFNARSRSGRLAQRRAGARGGSSCASASSTPPHAAYEEKVARTGARVMRHVEKQMMLQTLDQHWREHLAAMDYLRQGIHLRGYAQKDYRFEYKREAFELFAAMLERVKFETVSVLAKIEMRTQEQIDREEEERRSRLMRALQAQHAEAQLRCSRRRLAAEPPPSLAGARAPGIGAAAAPARPAAPAASPMEAMSTFVRAERKVGRNEPCPCGSGKKYKHCHGVLSSVQ